MKTAFKDWAVIVDALGRGEQSVIFRKGGLREGKGGFRPEFDTFLLFPTRYHQQGDGVVNRARARCAEKPGDPRLHDEHGVPRTHPWA